jgi:hypothetical protein
MDMASQARSAPDFAPTERASVRADASERVIFSAIEEPSDSVPSLKAMTVFGLIGGSILVWGVIAVAAWRAFT